MSNVVVRRLEDADVPAAADLSARINESDETRREATAKLLEAAYRHCPFMPPSLCWGAFDGDRLAAKWQAIDLPIRIAGNTVRIAGFQGVAANPEDNFKGYAKLIFEEAAEEFLAEGFAVIWGFAQRGGFYRRLGAVPVAAEYGMEVDSRVIPRLAANEDPFRLLETDDDIAHVIALHNESNQNRSGSVVRTVEYWPWMVRKAQYHWLTDDGYMGILFQEDSIEVKEIGAHDAAFYDLALRKLSCLARERGNRRIWGRIPPDHPFVLAAHRYGVRLSADVQRRSGCMAGIAVQDQFVEQVRPGLDERREAAHLPPLRINFGGAGLDACLDVTGGAPDAQVREIQLAIPTQAFLQWCFGSRSVDSSLVEYDAKVSQGDRDLLDRLFPLSHPFTWVSDRF